MKSRIASHLLFWFCFLLLYAIAKMLFAGPSDLKYTIPVRLLRFFVIELAFLPWKAIPFYFLFYFLIPKYSPQKQWIHITALFLGCLLICIFGYRAAIAPISWALYGEQPEFNAYSFNRWFYTITDIVPAIGLAATAKLFKQRLGNQQKIRQLEQERKATELKYLKAQANPHFLFNTLNNLYGLARKQDTQTAPSIMKLANIMRFMLTESKQAFIPLHKEIGVIEDFIALEKLRYNERLKLIFDQQIDNPKQAIPPLLLLPFVENAFKHGASESRFEVQIHISLQLKEGKLHFNITNPIGQDKHTEGLGIGLQNIRRQLDLIYGDDYQLNLQAEDAVFSVHLNIELKAYE